MVTVLREAVPRPAGLLYGPCDKARDPGIRVVIFSAAELLFCIHVFVLLRSPSEALW